MLTQLEDRLLVHEGERGNLLYFLFFFMLVSAGMAIGRGSADALFLKRLGIEYLPLMYMIQSLLLSAASLVYAAFADRIPAEKFFRALFVTLLVLVFGSWLVIRASGNSLIYPFYYLVYEVSSEILLVHAALYMNQNMTTLQTKRLAPLVYAGAQTGTILGGLLLVTLTPVLGTANLLLVWCALLAGGAITLFIRHQRHGTSTHFRAPARPKRLLNDCVRQVQQGIRYTYRSSLLRASSLALFFMVIAFYILCYSVNKVYTQTFTTEEELTRFFGMLTAATSLFALLTQLFITNRVIKRFGIRTINLLFPWTTFASLAALSVSFSFPVALAGSVNKDALLPAFNHPLRSMFFNVLPDSIQGRARAISVAVVLPLALLSGGLILVALQNLSDPAFYLVPGMLAALLFLYFNSRMNRAYVSTLITTLKERLFLPGDKLYAELGGGSDDVLQEILRGVAHPDTDVSIAFARVLVASFPGQAATTLLQRCAKEPDAIKDRYIRLLEKLDISDCREELQSLASGADAHLQVSILGLLLDKDEPTAVSRARQLLDSDNPRLRAMAIHAALHHPGVTTEKELYPAWQQLLRDGTNNRLAALDLIPDLQYVTDDIRPGLTRACREAIDALLQEPSEDIRIRTLRGLARWPARDGIVIDEVLTAALGSENPGLRSAAARCLHLASDARREALLLQAIGDGNPRVREAGIETFEACTDRPVETALDWITGNRGSLRAQQALLGLLLDSPLPQTDYVAIARNKTREARCLGEALSVLDATRCSDSACILLRHTLKEQLDQTIELVLQAMEPLYEPGTVSIIRAGFVSRDPRHVANACEALENLDRQTDISALIDILQQSASDQFTRESGGFQSIEDVLDWCVSQGSEWLRQCGTRARQYTVTEPGHA